MGPEVENPKAFKHIYSQEYVDALTNAVLAIYPAFNKDLFTSEVFDAEWRARPLKTRMRHISTLLHDHLPTDYVTALGILRRVEAQMSGYEFPNLVFSDFVGQYGLNDWEISIAALEQFNLNISAEFAVRPFIVHDQARMMAQMLAWAGHEDERMRRLASEGCRPRLPWGIGLAALKVDPSPILPILEQLPLDPSQTVRRSVANNLNDIAKDHPETVIEVLQQWQEIAKDEIREITKHALRTLLKAGHPKALRLLGYDPDPKIMIRNLTVEPDTISIGDKVTWRCEIESLSDEPQTLMIDYVVYLMRSKGQQTPKVFKLSKRTLAPGQVLYIERAHSFKLITTRVYYAGEHAIAPKVNGKEFERMTFYLKED